MEMPAKVKSYTQKYRSEWEKNDKYKGWLKGVKDDMVKAMCTLCDVQFTAKIWDINKHSSCRKHKQNIELKSQNKPLPFKPVPIQEVPKSREAEGVLSMFIAEHSSILSVDHLSEIGSTYFKESESTNDFKLHRTKCTQIIVYVLAPHFQEMLRKDIGNQKYSIILDESTDISVSKRLGLIIRYFSNAQNQIISAFLSLVHLEKSDAKTIADSLVNTLKAHNLLLSKMVGIGTDNASVMTGVNNGVHAILKRDYALEHLILIRCV